MTNANRASVLGCLILLINSYAIAQPTLYYNGKIFTADSVDLFQTYFVEEDGFITETGSTLSTENLMQYDHRIDLSGKLVIPGLIDSHIHFIDGALGWLQVNLSGISEPEALHERMIATRNNLLEGIYVARDLADGLLSDYADPIRLLDQWMPDVPAILFLKSGHAAIANSLGMRLLGFSPGTRVKDGTIELNDQGALTGYLLEGASMEALRKIGAKYTDQTIAGGILLAQQQALAMGITTIGDNTFSPYNLKIYQQLQKHGALKLRVWARSFGRIPETDQLMTGLGVKHLGFIGGGIDFSRVHYHAVKYFVDQSLSAPHTASAPAVPGGTVFLSENQLKDIFLLHPESRMAFHIQGKEGLDNVLHALSAIGRQNQERRHVFDHVGYATPEQLAAIKNLGQAVTIIAPQAFDYENILNAYKRSNQADLQEADLLNARAKFQQTQAALTSDYPYGMDTVFQAYPQVNGLNPFANLAVNVSGRYPDGRPIAGFAEKTLSLTQALLAYTTNGAFVLGEEQQLGKIAPAYRADFAILSEDIFQQPELALYHTQVQQTYIGGELVYDRTQATRPEERSSPIARIWPMDYVLSPVLGYDPTVGLLAGGAAFIFPLQTPGQYADIQMIVNGLGQMQLRGTYAYFGVGKKLDLKITGFYNSFLQYYFGEGDQTRADDFDELFAKQLTVRPALEWHLTEHSSIQTFVDWQHRNEFKVKYPDGEIRNEGLFPDESALSFGAAWQWDTRDQEAVAHRGLLAQLDLQYVPEGLHKTASGDLLRIQAELRAFRYFFSSKYVLATRLAAGFSVGPSSYLYRYTLGGAYRLRGYFDNRFRGNNYYLAQLEFRYPLYKRFSGAVFLDSGDIADTGFDQWRYTYGGGIRFALTKSVHLRLDYGAGKDQNGLFFTFGEAF